MTEAQWLACDDPAPMLAFLQGKVSDRKLRLSLCASCRRHFDYLRDERSRIALLTAERYAESQATEEERLVAREAARNAKEELVDQQDFEAAAVGLIAEVCLRDVDSFIYRGGFDPAFLRDIFGPLSFRPVSLDSAWLTPTVKQLAEGIYEERAFDRMPILGDALEDAGCADEEILRHCRSEGEHVRGCWVLDSVRGKS